ncbi:tRNA uridine-5-carboxymethylaminomethyl(34) synthesis GTPase MnmE [Sphingomonas adhaesiva]|uniref:tRNA uridine-5-carboxymethylaminomethyl(34) synthesis GTPase MnmE n=1 Tax=Sphingomonas adhaesiva TaxID=28212 RepID=UPI002FFB8EA6
MTDTIFALSSGRPPAAIAVMRISGPQAAAALARMAGAVPSPRMASLRTLRDGAGAVLDRALTIFFPGPATATGEDLVELHLHGGRAIVAAVEATLATFPGLRMALPGEFTRRALENGRLDVIQAEGLADLLEAETEEQRRIALSAAEGQVSRAVATWMDRTAMIAARIEAELDFGDEDDVAAQSGYDPAVESHALATELEAVLSAPSVERLRDGMLVVLAGPRNAGKSSLFNALLDREAAIVTPVAGTTRDLIEASVTRAGVPYRLVDTAGLTEHTDDVVEQIGISRARDVLERADVVLWLGEPSAAPRSSVRIAAKCDDPAAIASCADIAVSIHRPETIAALWVCIAEHARQIMGIAGDMAFRKRQRRHIAAVAEELRDVTASPDLLLQAEHIRVASRHLAALSGVDATEAMLDALFGRFCLGK